MPFLLEMAEEREMENDLVQANHQTSSSQPT
jgi:hypothetical protein